ncbi:MAG: hypothetical protein KDG50_02730 [Chromatiales bacterium]|nr:hypothetical protein [Chromatiales bacterium]
MLCVWWDMKGIIYYELLEPKQTVTANLYSQQLIRLSEALEKKTAVWRQRQAQSDSAA